MTLTSLGVELEMAVACNKDSSSHFVGPFFSNLYAGKYARGETAQLKVAHDGRDIAVTSVLGCTSLDNAFNNIESAIGPVGMAGRPGGLETLDVWVRTELEAVEAALAAEGAMVLNFSEHPALAIDDHLYQRIRAPKPIYDYWVNCRGWNHKVGIDAKAQNSPCTGVAVCDAVMALNTVLAASPAFIALFANSPFENGEYTGYRENRLTIWPRMFRNAYCVADDRLHRLPPQPFANLRGYFEWMFGADTAMQRIPSSLGNSKYKDIADVVCVEGNPSLLTFLRGKHWLAHRCAQGGIDSAQDCNKGQPVEVRPSLAHLAFQQFAQFLDARIRFGFAHEPALDEFFAAWERPFGLEDLFETHFDFCYIEGRSPGANFADREIFDEAGAEVAASVVMAPSALQAGLLRNPSAAWRWLEHWPWRALPALRDAAMRDGLNGRVGSLSVRTLCEELLEIAGKELSRDEAWMLAYPQHVLRSGRNGADRALAAYELLSGSPGERMKQLMKARQALFPSRLML